MKRILDTCFFTIGSFPSIVLGHPTTTVDYSGMRSSRPVRKTSHSSSTMAPVAASPVRSRTVNGLPQELSCSGIGTDALDINGDTPLMRSAAIGDVAAVTALLEVGASVGIVNVHGRAALHIAASKNEAALIPVLVNAGASINQTGLFRMTALMFAAEKGHMDAVRVLLDLGIDVNARSSHPVPLTALSLAAAGRHLEVFRVLLAAGADISIAAQHMGDTFLRASERGELEALELFLSAGVNVDYCDKTQVTALMNAAEAGNEAAVAVLLAHGANVNARSSERNSALLLAAAKGHFGVPPLLIHAGADVNVIGPLVNCRTALHWSVFHGRGETTELLINAGASLNAADSLRLTPLSMAITENHPEMVPQLLRSSPDLEVADKDGNTALLHAVAHGHFSVTQALLAAGANLTVQNKAGCNALHRAVFQGYVNMIKPLVEAGAEIDAPIDFTRATTPISAFETKMGRLTAHIGETPLMLAFYFGWGAAVDILLECGADPTLKTPSGRTTLHNLAHGGNTALIPRLLQAGADINAVDCINCTPLTLGIGSVNVIRCLLQHGAKLAVPGAINTLVFAVDNGANDDVVEVLLDAGADLNAVSHDGTTTLMTSASTGRLSLVRMLVDSGADVNAQNDNGMTALSFATLECSKDIAAFLRLEGGLCGDLDAVPLERRGPWYDSLWPDLMLHRAFAGFSGPPYERWYDARCWLTRFDEVLELAHHTAWIRRQYAIRLWKRQWS